VIASRNDTEIRWISSGSPSFFNAVLEVRATPARADALIEEAIAYFTARGVRLFAWRLQASDRPRDLRARLLARGFREIEVGPMMTLELEKFEVKRDSRTLDVRRVEGANSSADWASVVVPGFGFPLERCEVQAAWLRSLAGDDAARSFVGYAHETPVASAQTFFHDETAGVYWVATHPSERKKGYGTQVVLAALADAKERGAHVAVLHANEPAISLYKRIGFRECGYVKRYLWSEDSPPRT